MKKVFRHALCVLLVLLMLVPCLAACGGDDNVATTTAKEGNVTTAGGGSVATTAGGNDPQEDLYRDLGGYKYNAYVHTKGGNSSFKAIDFWVEEAGTEALSMAVYDRNAEIEAGANCQIIQIDDTESGSTMAPEILAAYRAGTKYELTIIVDMGAATCATYNLLAELNSQKNINLKADYFDQNSVNQLSLGRRLYYVNGDMNISGIENAPVILFNADILSKYPQAADPYELVGTGKWTVDAMLEIADLTAVDADGNGTFLTSDGNFSNLADNDKDDVAGYGRYLFSSGLYIWYGCGQRISTNDNVGYPELTIDAEGASDVADAIVTKLSTKLNPKIAPCSGGSSRNNFFKSGNVTFIDLILWDVRTQIHTDENIKYGILPIPMYSEEQNEYYSPVQMRLDSKTFHLWAIPTSCASLDKASYMFDLMAQKSSGEDGTMEAYFYQTMELSAAQDGHSRASLRIVRDSLTYDLAVLYNWGNYTTYIANLVSADSTKWGSNVQGTTFDKAVLAMEQTLDQFKYPGVPEE